MYAKMENLPRENGLNPKCKLWARQEQPAHTSKGFRVRVLGFRAQVLGCEANIL